MQPRIGVDLDNTFVCYEQVFRRLAEQRFPDDAIPDCGVKEHLRCRLRAAGREEEWTELQGEVYGHGMAQAEPFSGVLEFVSLCRRFDVPLCIISHRTRFPYRGRQHDLHLAALDWLAGRGLAPNAASGVPVHLELTKEDKLARIASERCTHFIDDLPELLAENDFPPGVTRILFDPHGRHHAQAPLMTMGSWRQIASWLEAVLSQGKGLSQEPRAPQ